ncbi:MAG: hypothetical protein K8S25_09530 [Alphaproteobacteria bacterium]|nr:hypothetical protein [Alphaproteobacteria bacterium]
MTVQVADTDKGFKAARPAVFWGVGILAALLLLYLVLAQVERIVSRWPSVTEVAVSPVHCEAFVALAKANYGADWKLRLDPRDTTCGPQVQQEWERQTTSRAVPEPETALTASELPPLTIAAPEAARSDTYCLNVISLAKVKYGNEWAARMDHAARQVCANDIGAANR